MATVLSAQEIIEYDLYLATVVTEKKGSLNLYNPHINNKKIGSLLFSFVNLHKIK
jgi:hypothetical protein